MPEFENTWKIYAVINEQFSEFHLEEKVKLVRVGIIGLEVTKTYVRRGREKKNSTGLLNNKDNPADTRDTLIYS